MKKILIHLAFMAVFAAIFVTSFANMTEYGIFVTGVVIGFLLLVIDRFLQVIFLDPDTEFSMHVRSAWQQRQFGYLVSLFSSDQSVQEKLTTRSVVFLVIYCALAIYVLTSTGSVLAVGVVLGLGAHYCLDIWQYRSDPALFHQHFLWQVQRQFSENEILAMVTGFTIFFALLCAMVLI